jgi:hypothetical protein
MATPSIPDEELARYRALFCPETALPTGCALLLDRTAVALRRSHRVNRHVAVIAFRNIAVEASMMPTIANAFRESLRPDDTIARVGDRALIAVCNEVADEQAVDIITARLVERSGVVCEVKSAVSVGTEQADELLAHVLAFGD